MKSNNFREKGDITPMLAVSAMVFFLTLSALSSVGFVPSYIDGVYPTEIEVSAPTVVTESFTDSQGSLALADLPVLGDSVNDIKDVVNNTYSIEPERIVIHSIGVDLPVLNPKQTSVAALDLSLLSGSVRYPLSANLNEDGNVFIFGHSTSVSIVKNKMFKAFNRISELEEGDTIKITGMGQAYIYRVSEVRRTDANEEIIDLSKNLGRKLTLATCDVSFGNKSARFVVEADFIGSYKDL